MFIFSNMMIQMHGCTPIVIAVLDLFSLYMLCKNSVLIKEGKTVPTSPLMHWITYAVLIKQLL